MKDWKDALKGIRNEMNASKMPPAAKPPPEFKKTLTFAKKGRASSQNQSSHRAPPQPARPPIPVVLQKSQPATPIRSVQPQRTQTTMVAAVSKPLPRAPQPQKAAAPVPIPAALAPVRRPLVSKGRFLLPEPWVGHSASHMLHKTVTAFGQPIDVVIGVDFGTSFTKVAVGLKDIIVPVDWAGVSLHPERFLLPSEFTELEDGTLVLGLDPSADPACHHQYLKQPFLRADVSPKFRAQAAAFLALVLRYVFAWIYRSHRQLLVGQQVRWMFNLGVPSDGLEVGAIELTYRQLATVAWAMGIGKEPIRLSDAEALCQQKASGQLPPGLIAPPAIIPEFVAQLASYVQSPQRTPGLHALVDVGGGTLDVVTFNVHRSQGEDVFPFFVPRVLTLGTQMVNHNRLEGHEQRVDLSKLPDELSHLLTYKDFADRTGLPPGHVFARDELLFREVQQKTKSVLQQTKARRYRHAPEWREGLRVFLTGGGAQVAEYRNSIEKGIKDVAQRVNPMPLPQHPRVAGFGGSLAEYQRISVACGLALDEFSLGQIRPASAVEDDKPGVGTAIKVDRPDRDDLYPH